MRRSNWLSPDMTPTRILSFQQPNWGGQPAALDVSVSNSQLVRVASTGLAISIGVNRMIAAHLGACCEVGVSVSVWLV